MVGGDCFVLAGVEWVGGFIAAASSWGEVEWRRTTQGSSTVVVLATDSAVALVGKLAPAATVCKVYPGDPKS